MCPICPHKATASNPPCPRLVTPVPCTFRVSPFWKGSSSFSVAWKLYRATDSIGGLWEGSRGCLGLAVRGALGSGLSARCSGGQETALMSALPGHHAGPAAAPQLPRCAAEAGGSRASPPGCQGIHVPKDGRRIRRFLRGEWWARPGSDGNGMEMGWARAEDFGKGSTGFWGWRAAQAVPMGESLVELPKGGLVGLAVPEAGKSRRVGMAEAEGGGWMLTPGFFGIQREPCMAQL